jgi:flagellar motor switch protein FliN/FliY
MAEVDQSTEPKETQLSDSDTNTGASHAEATEQQSSPVAENPNANTGSSENMDFLLDIPLEVSVELGRTKMLINELLKLGQGSVIELSKLAGETMEILANQKLIAKGEVVVVNEKYGIRLTEVISPMERVERLR